jgi:hypothetical protein
MITIQFLQSLEKNMKKYALGLLAGLFLMTFPFNSQAFELAVEGGLSMQSPSYSLSSGSSLAIGSKTSIGYGAFAGLSFLPGIQIETGLMYLPRRFSETSDTAGVAELTANHLIIPIMARFTALPLVSVGAGAYYAMGSGQVSTTLTPVGGSAGDPVLEDYDATGGIKKSGLGLMASARLELPFLPTIRLLVDARYLMDLNNRSVDAAETLKFKDLQLLAGASFGF